MHLLLLHLHLLFATCVVVACSFLVIADCGMGWSICIFKLAITVCVVGGDGDGCFVSIVAVVCGWGGIDGGGTIVVVFSWGFVCAKPSVGRSTLTTLASGSWSVSFVLLSLVMVAAVAVVVVVMMS